MRRNAAPAGAKLGEQVSQFVPQCALDLRRVMLAQTRIQRNELAAKIRASRGAEESRIPFHVDFAREFRGIESAQYFPGLRFEVSVAPQDDERRRRRENEIELAVAGLVVRLQGAAV